MSTVPFDILTGQQVRLATFAEADLPELARWNHDAITWRQMRATPVFPPTPGVLVEWLMALHRSSSDFIFAVRRTEDDELIGFVHLDEILWTHGVCGLAYLIGDAEHRGQGYGYEAADLALAYAFEELNLHRVSVTTYAYNQASLALAEKLGFRREGAYREFIHRDGQRYDMVLYGLLRPEWVARRANG